MGLELAELCSSPEPEPPDEGLSCRRAWDVPYPDLPVLGAQVKTKENHPKHQGFLPLSSPVKALEKQRKTAENTRNTKEFNFLA